MLERNTLLEKTFPKIKQFCQRQGYDFQVVDMRWGVRDESTDDHMGTELCLKELLQCRNMSTGPFFVVWFSLSLSLSLSPAKKKQLNRKLHFYMCSFTDFVISQVRILRSSKRNWSIRVWETCKMHYKSKCHCFIEKVSPFSFLWSKEHVWVE